MKTIILINKVKDYTFFEVVRVSDDTLKEIEEIADPHEKVIKLFEKGDGFPYMIKADHVIERKWELSL